MKLRSFWLLALAIPTLFAEEAIEVTPGLFRTPEFKERFVGSYGFLPAVEPKVDQEEARVIAELAEMLSASQFKKAEARLLAFIKQRKTPEGPEAESKDVSAALVFTLGNLYYQNGREAEAEKAYNTALKRFPEYRRAHKNLALVYARSERMEEAMPHLTKAIDLGDVDHLSFGLLGHAMLDGEKAVAAESAFRQAYLLNPDEKDWKIGLVQALLMKEDWVQASSMLQTLIDESPDDAVMWMQQANCYIQMDEIMKAAENYEVLRLKGLADESALNQLGDIYANQEEPLLALGAYLTAMRQSEVVKVDRSLKAAKYLLQLGASRESAQIMTEFRQKAGDKLSKDDKVAAFLVESDIAVAELKLAEAGALLEKALEISPANGSARVKLGKIFAERATLAESDEEIAELKRQARTRFLIAVDDRDADVAYQANLRLAQLLVKDAQYQKALPRLEQAVRLKTGSKQSIEQYLRRVQRAAEREQKRKEQEELERTERREAAEKAAAEKEEAEKGDEKADAAKEDPKEEKSE